MRRSGALPLVVAAGLAASDHVCAPADLISGPKVGGSDPNGEGEDDETTPKLPCPFGNARIPSRD